MSDLAREGAGFAGNDPFEEAWPDWLTAPVAASVRVSDEPVTASRRGFGRYACIGPEIVREWTDRFGKTIRELVRCGKCAPCLAKIRQAKVRKFEKQVTVEMLAASAVYFVTLTVAGDRADISNASLIVKVKRMIHRLRHGDVRNTAPVADKLGRVWRRRPKNKFATGWKYKFPKEKLPRLKGRAPSRSYVRLDECGKPDRKDLGFITGDPALRYAFCLEPGGRKGRLHVHIFLFVSDPEGCPFTGIAEAWPYGFVDVAVCGATPKDIEISSRYMTKYVMKNSDAFLRGISNGFGKKR